MTRQLNDEANINEVNSALHRRAQQLLVKLKEREAQEELYQYRVDAKTVKLIPVEKAKKMGLI